MNRRRLLIAGFVVLLHLGLLYALQAGLSIRQLEILIPAEVISNILTPAPAHETPPAPTVPQKHPPLPNRPAPATVAQPTPAPTPAPAPAPEPVLTATPASTATTMTAAAVAAPPPPPAPAAAAPVRVELPSTDAAYLHNPKPNYPGLSRRLGEQGKVVVRVLIEVDGTAQQAEIRTSSGFERLDQAALNTVRSWRYVPGKRNGVPEAMWFNVPINFVLE